MSFDIKNFSAIVAQMIAQQRGTSGKLTDFNVGSVNRTLIEAVSSEIEELYQQMWRGLDESIPTAIYRSFGFDRLDAYPAWGHVTFTANDPLHSGPLVVKKRTPVRVGKDGLVFLAADELIIPASQATGTVKVIAEIPGSSGNILSESITELKGVNLPVSVTNQLSFGGGRDIETDKERAQRWSEFILALSRGTIASIIYGSKLATIEESDIVVESVQYCAVEELFRKTDGDPIGRVNVYIWNGVDGASAELVAKVNHVLSGYYTSSDVAVMGWKAAGIWCDVEAVLSVLLDLTLTVTFDSVVVDAESAVNTTVRDYITSIDVGAPYIESELVCRIKRISGVSNVVISSPSGDLGPPLYRNKFMPGDITLTILNA